MQNEKVTPSKRKQQVKNMGKFALNYILIPMLQGAAVAAGGYAINKIGASGRAKDEHLASVTPIHKKAVNS